MSGSDRNGDAADSVVDTDAAPADDALARTAHVETTHADEATAATVAASLTPDNTDEIRTTAEGKTVTTHIERTTTGGLLASVDDYLVNLDVADGVAAVGQGRNRDTAAADDAAGANDADGIRDTHDRDTRDRADTHDT